MSVQSDLDDEGWDDEGWSEDEGAGGGIQYVSLFCDQAFPSAEECFKHDGSEFKFNLLKYRAQVRCSMFADRLLLLWLSDHLREWEILSPITRFAAQSRRPRHIQVHQFHQTSRG